MKKATISTIRVVAVCFIGIFAFSCAQFPTQFGYIGNEMQTIAFVFTPGAEGAPGDTLHVTGIFEGVHIESYTCSLSTRYQMTQYGSDTAFNFIPINDPAATISNDSVKFSIVLPPDFFTSNPEIFQRIITLIPDSLAKTFPKPLGSMSPEELNLYIGALLSQDFSSADTTTKKLTAELAKLLSGAAFIHMHINGGYTITRKIIIRYNSKMKNNPYIFTNTNPDPFWAGIYKVKNDPARLFFSPPKQTVADTLFCLYLKPGLDSLALAGPVRFTDTILIDTGYTYYAAADSGMIQYTDANNMLHRDTSLDKSVTYAGTFGYEYFSYLWFYRVDSLSGVAPINSVVVSNDGRNYYTSFLPPLDVAAQKITLWLNISDAFTGEMNRPVATSVKELHCFLNYTDRYTSSVKKK